MSKRNLKEFKSKQPAVCYICGHKSNRLCDLKSKHFKNKHPGVVYNPPAGEKQRKIFEFVKRSLEPAEETDGEEEEIISTHEEAPEPLLDLPPTQSRSHLSPHQQSSSTSHEQQQNSSFGLDTINANLVSLQNQNEELKQKLNTVIEQLTSSRSYQRREAQQQATNLTEVNVKDLIRVSFINSIINFNNEHARFIIELQNRQ